MEFEEKETDDIYRHLQEAREENRKLKLILKDLESVEDERDQWRHQVKVLWEIGSKSITPEHLDAAMHKELT